jgi:hypothetical protein
MQLKKASKQIQLKPLTPSNLEHRFPRDRSIFRARLHVRVHLDQVREIVLKAWKKERKVSHTTSLLYRNFLLVYFNITHYIEFNALESKKSRNPVRRSNSSPEMSSNWKNPFLNKEKLNLPQLERDDANADSDAKSDDLKKHIKTTYSKDMR